METTLCIEKYTSELRASAPAFADGSATRMAISERTLSYVDAIREATDQEMDRDASVILFGLDVDDPKAIQGTTRGLVEKYGADRVFGTPLSEDATTGVATGASQPGPTLVH